MPGIKGKRVPGRPGRFDPTIPLHMTTRKAAKVVPEMETYAEDEYDDSDSRRTSFDEISVATPFSGVDSEPPTKRQRTADPSPEQNATSVLKPEHLSTSGDHKSSGLFTFGNGTAGEKDAPSGAASAAESDVNASQGSIDPRLRESNGFANSQNDPGHSQSTADSSQLPKANESYANMARLNDRRCQHGVTYGAAAEDDVSMNDAHNVSFDTQTQADEPYESSEGEWRELVNEPNRESVSRRNSAESSRSDAQVVGEMPLPEVSTDATPMATRQGSPATTASVAAEELTPAKSKLAKTLEMNGSEVDDEADDGERATQNQDSFEAMEEDAEATRYAEEYEEEDAPSQKQKRKRPAGGRRRAAHSNAYVEAAMRRQLELKQFYRQVTRAMKSCLGELAQITLDELQADDQHHTQVAEYEAVIAGLDEKLAQRKQQLLRAQKLNHEQLKQRFEAESHARRNRCRNFLEDIKEQQLVNLEYNMLQVNRAKLREEAKPGHETEDEDGVIPRPKRMAYRFKRSNALDSRYDSRSRFTMETESRVEDLQRRTSMWEALRAYDAESVEEFTVMDNGARNAANEKRRNIQITKKLADIAAEYDRLYGAPVPPPAPPPTAEELAPLNALADLAVKPATRSSRSRTQYLKPSSTAGYPDQAHRQPPPSSRPPQPLFDRPTNTAPPHSHLSPFLRVAMEHPRGPSHGFGHAPAPPLAPSGVRQPENTLPPLSSLGRRSVDGRPSLAAKPAVYFEPASRDRFPPTQHTHYTHPSNRYQHIHSIMTDAKDTSADPARKTEPPMAQPGQEETKQQQQQQQQHDAREPAAAATTRRPEQAAANAPTDPVCTSSYLLLRSHN